MSAPARSAPGAVTAALGPLAALLAFGLCACEKDLGLELRRFRCFNDDECARGSWCDQQLGYCRDLAAADGGIFDAGRWDSGLLDSGRSDLGGADLGHDSGVEDLGIPDLSVRDVGPQVIDLAAGLGHTCALLAGGAVRCWGANDWAQLGQGSASEPVHGWREVPGLGEVVQIRTGSYHTCVRERSGDVRCWGKNLLGQSGGTGGELQIAQPGPPVVRGAIDLAIGPGQVSCAITSTDGAKCWGMALEGHDWCGEDCGVPVPVPTPIPALTSTLAVTQIAVGTYHACAAAGGRDLFCWGNNAHGQIGDGSIGTERPMPVPITIATPITALSLGDHESCALIRDELQCWGNWDTHMPAATVSPPVAQMGMGWRHGCSRLVDGRIFCWGETYYGAAGSTPGGGWRSPAGPIAGLPRGRALKLAVGAAHNCALFEDGLIYCWGQNNLFQLGRETATESNPIPAPTAL